MPGAQSCANGSQSSGGRSGTHPDVHGLSVVGSLTPLESEVDGPDGSPELLLVLPSVAVALSSIVRSLQAVMKSSEASRRGRRGGLNRNKGMTRL